MKLKALFFGFALGLFSLTVTAGGNHGHSHSNTAVNQVTATTKANDIVAAFVKSNKLDKSWASIKANSVDKKTFKGNPEWLAIFINKNVADTKKQKLYVFLTLGGDYIAANYTGN